MDRTELTRKAIELQEQVNRTLRRYSPEAWMDLSLTIAQLKSLFFIDSEGSTNFRKLAAALRVTPSNVTGIIDRLVEQGLVSRLENPEDRRELLLQTTEKGEVLLGKLRERRVSYLTRILDRMSLQELSILVQAFTVLLKAGEVDHKVWMKMIEGKQSSEH